MPSVSSAFRCIAVLGVFMWARVVRWDPVQGDVLRVLLIAGDVLDDGLIHLRRGRRRGLFLLWFRVLA
jgi:hypothetical protein